MENEGFGRGIVGVCVPSEICTGVGTGVAPGDMPWIHPALTAPANISVKIMNARYFIWVSVGRSNIIFFINVMQESIVATVRHDDPAGEPDNFLSPSPVQVNPVPLLIPEF
jgi:hypothetical protein